MTKKEIAKLEMMARVENIKKEYEALVANKTKRYDEDEDVVIFTRKARFNANGNIEKHEIEKALREVDFAKLQEFKKELHEKLEKMPKTRTSSLDDDPERLARAKKIARGLARAYSRSTQTEEEYNREIANCKYVEEVAGLLNEASAKYLYNVL